MRDPRLPVAAAAIALLGSIAMPAPGEAQTVGLQRAQYYDNRAYDDRYERNYGDDRYYETPQQPGYAQQYPPPRYSDRDRPQPFDYRYRPQRPYWQNEPGAELYYGEATRQLNLEQLDPGW